MEHYLQSACGYDDVRFNAALGSTAHADTLINGNRAMSLFGYAFGEWLTAKGSIAVPTLTWAVERTASLPNPSI